MQPLQNPQEMKIKQEFVLDFCTITLIKEDIAVLKIQDGIEVDIAMADELISLANKTMDGPFGMISDRIHSYSLSFGAMTALAHYEKLAAIAIVVHTAKSRMLVETQNFFISAIKKKPIKVFMDYDSAIHWLRTTLADEIKNP